MPRNPSEVDAFAAAVALGDPAIIRSAIEHGVDVNSLVLGGTPPIVLAAVKRHDAEGMEPMVRLLLDSGADPDQPDRLRGMTALHAAAARGYVGVARDLLASGALVDRTFGTPPMTALGVAFRRGHPALFRLLLDSAADPNGYINLPDDAPDQQRLTPLIFAASVGDVETCRLLIDRGADLDAAKADGMTALMAAALNGFLAVVKTLADSGADLNLVCRRDPYKPFTALDLAMIGRRVEIVAHLQTRGAISAS